MAEDRLMSYFFNFLQKKKKAKILNRATRTKIYLIFFSAKIELIVQTRREVQYLKY